MNQILQLSSDKFQKRTLTLQDGTTFDLTMYFVPMQKSWIITELVYGTFTLNGLKISNSPNFLRQFRHRIPFGLACFSINDREPGLLEDFSSGNSKLFILTQADVAAYEAFLSE